jgi:hypothetical protein
MSAALDAAWQDAGWGPREATPVAGHDPPLLFSLRWPQAWQVDELDAEAQSPTWITTQRVRLALPREEGGHVVLLGALTVSLADVGEPPPVARTSSVRTAPLGDGGPSVEMLVVRFMLTTPYGLLSLAFTALQPQFYDVMEAMFDSVAQTARLDPCALS